MTTQATAIRTQTGKYPVITVTFPDGTTRTASGKRAMRATTAIATRRGPLYYVELRADSAAAEREAARVASGWTRSGKHGQIEVEAADYSEALPVREG
jgi:hypothetical protein